LLIDEYRKKGFVADVVYFLVELGGLMEVDCGGFVFLFFGEAGYEVGGANFIVH
jgi:hypothetical protein